MQFRLKINRIFVYSYILFIAIFLLLIINFYNDEKENENRENRIYLQTIANIKSSEIKQWLSERLSDAAFLHSNDYLNEALPKFIKQPAKTDSLKISKSIESMYKNHDYKNILIINKDYKSILCMDTGRKEAYNLDSINSAIEKNKIIFSNFYLSQQDSGVDLDIYIPVFNMGNLASVIIMKIDPYELIFPIIQDWVIQTSSGESFLVYRDADSVVFINKVKFKDTQPLTYKYPVSSEDLPAAMAVRGIKRIVEGTDYRGEKVLADIRPLENTPWFLVTKIDLPEIYLPASNRISFILLFLFPVFIVAGLSFLYFHSRHNFQDLLKINESTKKFEALYRASNDAILIIDNGKIVNCNPKSGEIFKTEEINILNKSLLDLSPVFQPDGTNSKLKLLDIMESLEKGELQLHPWLFKYNDKETYCEINLSPLLIDKKKYTVAIVRDITKRKQEEEELNESEGRYRSLFEKNHSVMLLIDPDSGQIINANPAACRFYGYSPEEITLLNITEINQMGNEDVFKEMQKAREEKRNQFFFHHKLANGEVRDVEVYSGPISFYGKTLLYSIVHDITDRRRVEEALTESLSFHQTLSRTIPFGMQIVDMRGKILFANETLQRLIPEDMMGRKCWEVYKDNKKQCNDCPLHNPGPAGTTSVIEVEGVNGGRTFQIHHTAMMYKGKLALLEIFQDVTERKRTEETINKLTAGIEQSPVTIVITDINGNIEYVNPQFIKTTGYTFDEVRGKNPRMLKSSRMTRDEYKDLWKTILDKKDWQGELLNKKKSGEEYWESALISPILNSRGEIINFIAIKEDITEQKKAAQALQISEKRFRSLFENMLEGFSYSKMIYDEIGNPIDFEYLEVNAAFENLTGLKNVTGRRVSDLIPGIRDTHPELFEIYSRVALTGNPEKFEIHFAPFKQWFAVSVYSNEKEYFIAVIDNITEQKKAEEAIKKYNEELEEKVKERTEQLLLSNKELEAFSYSVSHDLRAPLRAVNGYAKMLEEDYYKALDDEGKRLLGVIKHNAVRMGNLIDDLLAFSRLGRKDVQKTKVNMQSMAEEISKELNKIVKHHAEVRIGNLHPSYADSVLINNVFSNLISNAIKYSSKEEKPVIEIDSEYKNGEVIYSIHDNGVGFDMQYAGKLFGVFQRLHKTEEFEGTGVGLAIVQRIIHKHGGKVWANGKPGEGATFYFSLPVQKTGNVVSESN